MKQNIKNFMLMGMLCLSSAAFAQVGIKTKDKPKAPDLSLNLKKYIDPANMDLAVKPVMIFLNMPMATG